MAFLQHFAQSQAPVQHSGPDPQLAPTPLQHLADVQPLSQHSLAVEQLPPSGLQHALGLHVPWQGFSQPLSQSLSQSAWSGLQLRWQLPLLQLALPLAGLLHTWPHAPQLSGVFVAVSHPSAAPAEEPVLQSAQPASQTATAQRPSLSQIAVACGRSQGSQLGSAQPVSTWLLATHWPLQGLCASQQLALSMPMPESPALPEPEPGPASLSSMSRHAAKTSATETDAPSFTRRAYYDRRT